MEIIYFTIAAVLLYLISDWIVNMIERKRGERLQNRSILFFVIIFTLSAVSFSVIQHLNQSDDPADNANPAPASSDKAKAQ
jgi:predicted PurR-regulated permease PerM